MKQYVCLGDLRDALEHALDYQKEMRGPVRDAEDRLDSLLANGGISQRSNNALLEAENLPYTLVSLLGPQLHGGKTTVSVRGPVMDGGDAGTVVAALPHLLRKVFRYGDFDRVKELAIRDFCLGWGVTEIVMEDVPFDRSDKAVIPVPRYVHPEDFALIPDGDTPEECSGAFRRVVIERERLLDMAKSDPAAGWNVSVIRALSPVEGDARRRDGRRATSYGDVVEYWEGWVRPASISGHLEPLGAEDSPDEYDGVRVYITEEGEHVRKMHHHYGTCGSPYTVWGAISLPKNPYPLGLAVALAPSSEAYELSHRRIQDQVDRQRRIVFARMDAADLESAIENTIDGIVPVGAAVEKDSIWEANLFGPITDLVQWMQLQREFLDRMSGLTDMMRGKTGSRVSATEASMAYSASNSRIGGLQFRVDECIRRIANQVGFVLATSEKVKMYLSGDAFVGFEGQGKMLYGGGLAEDSPWDSLGIEIIVGAESASTPMLAAQKIMQVTDVAAKLGQLKMQFPTANIDEIMRLVADAMQVPELRGLVLGEPSVDAAPPQQVVGPTGIDYRAMPRAAGAGAVLGA